MWCPCPTMKSSPHRQVGVLRAMHVQDEAISPQTGGGKGPCLHNCPPSPHRLVGAKGPYLRNCPSWLLPPHPTRYFCTAPSELRTQ